MTINPKALESADNDNNKIGLRGKDWTRFEVELTVNDYFQMLLLESRNVPYNKSQRNADLRTILTTRSHRAVEQKHQNISSALDQLGLRYIAGYKPLPNSQGLLREVVREYVLTHQKKVAEIVDNFEDRTTPGEQRLRGVFVDPPVIEPIKHRVRRARLPRKIDYAARDERNRTLGRNGESWVVDVERARLVDEHRPDLAEKIDWVSESLGDGAGYDILSYAANGEEMFIEVKTTTGVSQTPFMVSQNEVEFSEEKGDAFYLYRVFDFATEPKLFVLRGGLKDLLDLEPMDYRARRKAIGS